MGRFSPVFLICTQMWGTAYAYVQGTARVSQGGECERVLEAALHRCCYCDPDLGLLQKQCHMLLVRM